MNTIPFDCSNCLWHDKCRGDGLDFCGDFTPLDDTDGIDGFIEEQRGAFWTEWGRYAYEK